MDVVIEKKNNCELVISSIGYFERYLVLSTEPTVCLIAVNEEYAREEMSSIIRKVLSLGAVAFLVWGNFSEKLEDLIDEIIEHSSDKDLTHILTLSQKDEEVADVAWFFINSLYLEGGSYRCLALFDVHTTNWDVMQKELKLLMK